MADEANRGRGATPVIIVGGGPVGLVLAMFLDFYGVRSLVLNKDASTRWHPKGNTHNSRSMEHYRRLGVADKIRKLGLPPDHPTDVAYFTRLNAWEMARIPMPSENERMRLARSAPATSQVPEPIFRANQMYVEAFLYEHAKTLANVELRFGWQCDDWTQSAQGVTAEISDVASGRQETVSGAYLIGCDGAQSFVRRKLGIRYSGESELDLAIFGGRMVATYLRVPDLYRRVIRRPAWQYWAVNSELRACLLPLDGADDFLLHSKLGNGQEKPDDAAIAAQVRAIIGEDLDVELLGHRVWTAGRALVADRFGEGRVFLAGDAVHIFTPTGGFGMNTGIDDAANLAWKLAACVQGWGGKGLLASYEIERRPIALRNTTAGRQLAFNIGDIPAGGDIEEDTAAGAAARATAGRVLATLGEEFASLGIQLGARYDGSPIIVPDGTAPPPDDPATYVPSACPGGRAPHLWLADRSSLFDHFGPGFTLLRMRGAERRSDALAAAARARGIALDILDIDLAEARDLYQCNLALVRPDQHVAWRGDALPEDCDALMARVTGA